MTNRGHKGLTTRAAFNAWVGKRFEVKTKHWTHTHFRRSGTFQKFGNALRLAKTTQPGWECYIFDNAIGMIVWTNSRSDEQ